MSIEGIIWYLFLLDSLGYNVMILTKDKWHNRLTHWIASWFPLNWAVGILYLGLVLWVGSALFRLGQF